MSGGAGRTTFPGWRLGRRPRAARSEGKRWRRFAAGDMGEEGFKDKLLGLMDKAREKVAKRDSVAGAAIRAHGEGEAERIIRLVGAELGLPESMEELRTLRQGDLRGAGEGQHLDDQRVACSTALHGASCRHEPACEPDSERSQGPENPQDA